MKRWGFLKIHAMPVEVVECTPKEVDDALLLTDNDHAAFDGNNNVIRLHADSNKTPAARMKRVMHETFHGWFEHSGARVYLRGLLKMQTGEFDPVEEVLVEMLSAACLSSFPTLARMFEKFKAAK